MLIKDIPFPELREIAISKVDKPMSRHQALKKDLMYAFLWMDNTWVKIYKFSTDIPITRQDIKILLLTIKQSTHVH